MDQLHKRCSAELVRLLSQQYSEETCSTKTFQEAGLFYRASLLGSAVILIGVWLVDRADEQRV
jgi:hypothetical protein